MKRIHVVAGILRDAQGRVLLAQRGTGKHLEGLWEFPGGKVDPGESPLAALSRELHEEIGVEVDAATPLISVPWHYPGKRVELDVHEVTTWRGEPHGREGQAIAWCTPEAMHEFEMPAADRPVVAALRLSRRMLVTPGHGLDDPAFMARLERAFCAGLRLVQLRAPGLDETKLEAVAARLHARAAAHGATLVVNGSVAIAQRLGLGLHLGAAAARAHGARPVDRARWFGVSAHDATELAHAQVLDADYVVLGPVHETATHAGAPGLGWARFAALARELPLPCFAIGGLAPHELEVARAHGAFGVAGIRAFLPV